MTVKVGELKEKLIIEKAGLLPDGLGGGGQWVSYGILWGKVEIVSGRELFGAGQLVIETYYRITTRYRDDLFSGTYRLRWNYAQGKEKILRIRGIIGDPKRETLTILCVEDIENATT